MPQGRIQRRGSSIDQPTSVGTRPLDEVLITAELERRSGRAPDHALQARALDELAGLLADKPGEALQRLTDVIVRRCGAGSAGVSLIETVDGERVFRWVAIAGDWHDMVGGSLPINESPCKIVIDSDTAQLFALPERHYPIAVPSPVVELLLVPFRLGGVPIGTLWAIAHNEDRSFDREDVRLLESLSRFASTILQTTRALQEREQRQSLLLRLTDALRPLSDPAQIIAVASRLLGEGLGVGQIGYAEADPSGEYVRVDHEWNDGSIASNARVHQIADFGGGAIADLNCGKMIVVDDVTSDPRTNSPQTLAMFTNATIAAFLNVPLLKQNRLVAMLTVHSKGPRKWSEDETALTRDVAERTLAAVERARAEAQLRESEERYRTLFEAAELRAAELEAVLESMSDAVYIGNIEGITLINQAALDQLGFTTKEELNRHVAALVEDIQTRDAESGLPIPLEQQAFVRALNGERVIHEVLVRHKISGEERIVRCAAAPVRIDGRVIAAVAVNTDITEAKRAEATLHRNFDDLRALQERQEILVAELQHRVRNMLTVVRSVFARTVDVSRDVPELSQHFRGRLDALARTQVIVTQSPRGLVDLEGLVRDELLSVAASDGPLLTIEGPDIALTPKIAESMGLAIHELTMNAVKYGALKVTGATLAIEWTIDLDHSGQRRLTFRWTEQGVPAVPLQPAREGFGRELIEDALPYQMGADTSLEFRGGGICCTISVLLPEAENASAPLGARVHG